MKKLLLLSIACFLFISYSFAYEATSPEDLAIIDIIDSKMEWMTSRKLKQINTAVWSIKSQYLSNQRIYFFLTYIYNKSLPKPITSTSNDLWALLWQIIDKDREENDDISTSSSSTASDSSESSIPKNTNNNTIDQNSFNCWEYDDWDQFRRATKVSKNWCAVSPLFSCIQWKYKIYQETVSQEKFETELTKYDIDSCESIQDDITAKLLFSFRDDKVYGDIDSVNKLEEWETYTVLAFEVLWDNIDDRVSFRIKLNNDLDLYVDWQRVDDDATFEITDWQKLLIEAKVNDDEVDSDYSLRLRDITIRLQGGMTCNWWVCTKVKTPDKTSALSFEPEIEFLDSWMWNSQEIKSYSYSMDQ